ncbi:malonyl-CoA synthase [Pararhodobacter marinus]|uniref:Malonyl-CoA synthase n=1 Tax=Pararhodobacter marinus TaxID=2184063 RepID=A0A2U2C7Q5_9RHOB|nr:malonyl-CoA synthase [Pararhodobacter marinus]PWE27881.1 malonyl-CoA synthase [Pararhodobacter marinus]
MTNPLYDRLFAPHEGSDRVFLYLPDGAEIAYRDFLARAAAMASALADLGLKPGDRVAVQVEKSPEALMLYAACVRGGFVFLPLNTAYTGAELDYFVTDSGAALTVCDPKDAETLAPIAGKIGGQVLTLDASGGGSLVDRARDVTAIRPVETRAADDLAALLYTSGTTGRSKGAMLLQSNLMSNAQTLVDLWRFTADDVLLHALPVFHTHGLFVATNVILSAGASMVFFPRLDVPALLDHMPRATTLMGVPTFYTRLLADPRLDREVTAGMRLFISGSAPLLEETHRQFEARTGHRILERYGMTETNMNTSNPYEGDRRPGTVGPAMPGIEVKVTDPATGAELPRGEVGMIEVRGPNVFKGYWNMPEKTAEELRADGFFITGDLGTISEDGYVSIVGRGKDLIISGGYNIYPKEVELELDAQPGVLESAVVGVPHPDFGETVLAVLVPEPGATPDTDAIRAALDATLARFKQPRHYIVIDALPRNTMGKVQKAALRETYRDIARGQ